MSQAPTPPTTPPVQTAKPAAPAPKRRRRRWPWVILILLLLVVGLVALGPTLASTSPVRSMVLSQVNNNLNGKVTIDDWSLGWFSQTHVS